MTEYDNRLNDLIRRIESLTGDFRHREELEEIINQAYNLGHDDTVMEE